MHRVAVSYLQVPNGKVVCQIRSNIPNIAVPGTIAGFGGRVEGGKRMRPMKMLLSES